jgi:hypothetical protein
MRLLHIIYFSKYYELSKSGRDPQKGRINDTLLSAAIIILNIVSIVFLLFRFAPHSSITYWLQHSVSGYQGGGKALGKLVAAILMAVISGLLWLTVGSKQSYNRIAENYMQLPEETQKKTIRQSLFIFLFSFGLFLILVFTM